MTLRSGEYLIAPFSLCFLFSQPGHLRKCLIDPENRKIIVDQTDAVCCGMKYLPQLCICDFCYQLCLFALIDMGKQRTETEEVENRRYYQHE